MKLNNREEIKLKKVLKILSLLFVCIISVSLSACSNSKQTDAKILSITAITDVLSSGQKLTAVAVEYDQDIDNFKLKDSTFSVDERTITKVYANNELKKSDKGVNGKYAIIELSEKDENAGLLISKGMSSELKDAKVSVKQVENVTTVSGGKCPSGTEAKTNDKVVNLVVDDFKQFEFTDPATGKKIGYNLYIPKNYDKSKSYPMVTFMHDASITGGETKTTLLQGNGAIVWASEAEQAKHECFVLAPQYPEKFIGDNQTTDYLDATVNLINSVAKEYNIDTNRLYATGQSGGCMMSIAMNIKYPNLFAASYLVAGQWEAQAMTALKDKNLWIVVSEGDGKAFPGMNSSTEALEAAGAKISRATWNGRASAEEFTKDVNDMITEGKNIKYTVLKKGTVVSEGIEDNAATNHMYTWWNVVITLKE
jgi:predicted peptidase